MLGVVLDEVTVAPGQTGCMKFVTGVLYDEAFHKRPEDATPIQDSASWCMVCFLTRPPPDSIRQDS